MIRQPIFRGRFDLFEKNRISKWFPVGYIPSSKEIHDKIKAASHRNNGICNLNERISLSCDPEDRDEEIACGDHGYGESDCDGYIHSPVLCDPIHRRPYRILLMWIYTDTCGDGTRYCSSGSLQLPQGSKHPGVYDYAPMYEDSTFDMERSWAELRSPGRINELFSINVTFKVELDGPGHPEHTHKAEFWALRSRGHNEEDLKTGADKRTYDGQRIETESEEEYDSEEGSTG